MFFHIISILTFFLLFIPYELPEESQNRHAYLEGLLNSREPTSVPIEKKKIEDVKINLKLIDDINKKYPNLLSPREIQIIKTRLRVAKKQVSILMLLGKQRDDDCKLDPTYCIGKTIANVTQLQPGYLDLSDTSIHSDEIKRELTMDGSKYTILIDNLEKFPGSKVMNLFRFIDRDHDDRRKGMLLFIVYRGGKDMASQNSSHTQTKRNLREAEIVEQILTQNWSSHVPKDSLTSVISRISASVVKVY